eukprot:TRINITY_DN5914_c0_g2_i10.p1 TRINITY_DN5914_c0_g2~~TRINITY_DN5914_c0_g2_i10.p1  ORF type:complete len:263 (+),score=68.08 TRINITY_DN5914_c0_g2_i10:1637-2425(+)
MLTLPRVLVLHLKRFQHSSSVVQKLDTLVNCPILLSLEEFLFGGGSHPPFPFDVNHLKIDGYVREKETQNQNVTNMTEEEQIQYAINLSKLEGVTTSSDHVIHLKETTQVVLDDYHDESTHQEVKNDSVINHWHQEFYKEPKITNLLEEDVENMGSVIATGNHTNDEDKNAKTRKPNSEFSDLFEQAVRGLQERVEDYEENVSEGETEKVTVTLNEEIEALLTSCPPPVVTPDKTRLVWYSSLSLASSPSESLIHNPKTDIL